MGKLLMISLVWTLVSALLFQPALMGAPPFNFSAAQRAKSCGASFILLGSSTQGI